jgi:energy-coupling factor transporter ATP-binding protein EcfA2
MTSEAYYGMRWFKCDFQVQTPEDSKNWKDDDLRLGNPRRPKKDGGSGKKDDESGIREKARRFLKRCHELELDVIGITDHNFSALKEPRDWFLTHLIEQNESVAEECQRPPLFIFPGFEVDIGYHVLCLFEPVQKAQDIKLGTILTKLGLSEEERFREGTPQKLRREQKGVSLKELLGVVQGEYSGLCIAAHADQKDGLLSDANFANDFRDLELFAIEITQNPPAQRYADILNGRNSDWRRDGRYPAQVMSSDAKSLTVDKEKCPNSNSLGYRFTWVRMSQPSIEALRQAFLDPESRIRLPKRSSDDKSYDPQRHEATQTHLGDGGEQKKRIRYDPQRPEATQTHPRIKSVSLSGMKFLEDQTIHFSPNLNCIIGGRGSGKSTVLESLRLAFGHDDEKRYQLSEVIGKKLARVKKSFDAGGEIVVEWEGSPGAVEIVKYSPQTGERGIEGASAEEVSTRLNLLPVQFFSQRQVSEITETGTIQLLQILDAACGDELQILLEDERQTRSQIETLFKAQDELKVIEEKILRMKREIAELNRQWQIRKDVEEPARAYRQSRAAEQYLERIEKAKQRNMERIGEIREDIADSHAPLGEDAQNWNNAAWFQSLDGGIDAANRWLCAALNSIADEYAAKLAEITTDHPQWQKVQNDLKTADERFHQACTERGLNPQDVERLQEIDRTRRSKQVELQRLEDERKRLEVQTNEIEDRRKTLHKHWKNQFELRRKVCERINDKAKPAVKMTVAYGSEQKAFQEMWRDLVPDKRLSLGKAWDAIGDALHKKFAEDATKVAEAISPWETLEAAFNQTSPGGWLPNGADREELQKYLRDQKREQWRETRLRRVPDATDITLFYPGGTEEAGKISDEGTLSEGQRNTAVLNVLLALGEGPIVIDQPEDELDSNFIFRDLVPLLRSRKEERQLILATHNANLPVNADAELIYALKAERRGDKTRGVVRKQGGLDHKDVAGAVLDIMEGSQEAFQKRREKYNF